MFSLRSVAIVVLTASTLVVTAGSAFAQQGGGGGGGGPGGRGGGGGGRMPFGGGGGPDGMMPAINTRQVEHYSKILNLTKDQQEAASALLEGYAQQAAVSAKVMRTASDKAREDFRQNQDPSVFDKLTTSMTKFRDDRKKLDEGFMNDLKSVVTPQQAEQWPAVERAQRRDTTLRNGRMSGERVDLLELTDQQKFPEAVQKEIKPLLSQYEEELDAELVRRNEVYQKSMDKMQELRRAGNMDAMQDLIQKGREAGIRVREINRKYARQILDTLPDDKKAAFETEFKKASYPDIFRKGYQDRVAESVVAMADLTSDQKEQVTNITKKYQADVEALNNKLIPATEEQEMKFNIKDMANRGWQQNGPLQDLRQAKRDAEKKVIDDLTKVLSEDQRTRLPEKTDEEKQQDRGRGGGGNNGGNNGGGRGGQRPANGRA